MSAAAKTLRLPPLAKVSDLLRLYGLQAKKQLSQNFILDLNVTDKMVRKMDVFDCHVVEVGSGLGSLTRSLLNGGVRHVHGVEVDERFIPSLEMVADAAHGHLTIHHRDILHFDFSRLMDDVLSKEWDNDELPNLRLVGNLPFNVSIPLLLQWLYALTNQCTPFSCGRVPMSLVFQREVADGILACERSTLRSRLSVMTQYCCEVKPAMQLNSSVFTPRPKVDATLVNFIPRKKPLIDAPHFVVEQVVKAAFAHKRKFVRTPLQYLFPGEQSKDYAIELLNRAQVDGDLRAHQLSLEHFNALCQAFMEMCAAYQLVSDPLPVNQPNMVKGFVENNCIDY